MHENVVRDRKYRCCIGDRYTTTDAGHYARQDRSPKDNLATDLAPAARIADFGLAGD